MKYIIACLSIALVTGCGSDTTSSNTRQIDFRNYKIGDSILPLIDELEDSTGVVLGVSGLNDRSYVILGVKEDGSDTYHGNDDALVNIAVWTMPNSDKIAEISWMFPSTSNKTLFRMITNKIGEPHDTKYRSWQNAFGAQLTDELHTWRLAGNVGCEMHIRPFKDGHLVAHTDEYAAWQDQQPRDPEEDPLEKRL